MEDARGAGCEWCRVQDMRGSGFRLHGVRGTGPESVIGQHLLNVI